MKHLFWKKAIVAGSLVLGGCGDDGASSPSVDISALVPAELVYATACAPRAPDADGDMQWLASLAATGCYEQRASQWEPIEGAFAYDVRSPLWSDAAEKRRFVFLPEGQQIELGEGGRMIFPDGTVVAKDFVLDGVLVETRLMMREGPRWAAITYRWRADGSDADAVPDGIEETIGGQLWTFPSEADCQSCHTRAAGAVLGLHMEQMQRSSDMFGLGEVDQIAALEYLELFDRPVTAADRVAPLAPIDDEAASIEYRARSYLAANCAGCHRPGGAAHTDVDLRMATRLADTTLCLPSKASYGFPSGSLLIEPGNPESSVLLHIMNITGEGQMPPLGVNTPDHVANALLSEWILNMENCE